MTALRLTGCIKYYSRRKGLEKMKRLNIAGDFMRSCRLLDGRSKPSTYFVADLEVENEYFKG